MENVEKVIEFLDKAKVFMFLTTDGDQPRGRPFVAYSQARALWK